MNGEPPIVIRLPSADTDDTLLFDNLKIVDTVILGVITVPIPDLSTYKDYITWALMHFIYSTNRCFDHEKLIQLNYY